MFKKILALGAASFALGWLACTAVSNSDKIKGFVSDMKTCLFDPEENVGPVKESTENITNTETTTTENFVVEDSTEDTSKDNSVETESTEKS